MANNSESNVTRKLARSFLKGFEASKVLIKNIDTQLLRGKFTPSSGSTTDFKRPHDYTTTRTPDGNISSATKNDILSGKATGVVQDYFTEATEWGNLEEAIGLDQLDEILAPMATRMVTDLELDLGSYMQRNANLSVGTPGTAVDQWSDIAGAAALMESMGIPKGDSWCYVMNPYTSTNLANTQAGLHSGSNSLVDQAWKRAVISEDFAGMRVMSSNALKSRRSMNSADRAGAINGTPSATYIAHKDTMIQEIPVNGFTGTPVIRAGDVVEITGRHRLSLATREPILDAAGNAVRFRGVVVEDVTLVAGAGVIKIAGAAISETNGQYNTVDAPLDSGDVVTVLGANNALYQPNLFFHKRAFGMGTVKLPKLYSTDTVATTEEGISIRVSKYSDGDANKQMVRFDLLPAFATFNPFYAGHGYGV